MPRFDFRRQLKKLSIKQLKQLESKYLDFMIDMILMDNKERDRHIRYVGYIQSAIKKLENN
jgi:hypothetical protein